MTKDFFTKMAIGVVLVLPVSVSATDIFPIGTVMPAIIEESFFQTQMGTEWVLMDGRCINKTNNLIPHLDGAKCSDNQNQVQLPDARGKFLRMADTDSGNDPDAPRILGSYQGDGFKSHNHGGGEHKHYFRTSSGYNGANPASDVSPGGTGYKDSSPVNYTSGSGNIIDNNGGEETRPKNIAVNYFIKITTCKTTQCK